MKCDIIVVSWNACETMARALLSIRKNTDYPYRLIVIDNASDERTVSMLREAETSQRFGKMVLVQNSENHGWTKALNQGLEIADAPYVCIMNNDILAGPDWLGRMIRTIERNPEIGLANPEERRQDRKDITFEEIEDLSNAASVRSPAEFTELDYCSGFCMLIRREVIEKIGNFDEAYEFGYFEDEDYSRRALRSGFLCVRCHDALVFHLGSQSFGKDWDRQRAISERNRAIYEQKWGKKQNVLILAKYAAGEELLRMARQGVTMYVVENRHVNPTRMPSRHASIRFRGSWFARFFETIYFIAKARYLRQRGKIDSAIIKYRSGNT